MEAAPLRPDPPWWRLIMLCATAFSIEMAYAVEAGYGTPALLKTGLPERYASAMWAAGPVLGVLFQGYLGAASDRCRSRFGRRRPFILALALAACASLALFPYGRLVGGRLPVAVQRGFIIVFTAATFIAMDFSLDAMLAPTRAYLLDSVSVEWSTRANFLFSALVGLGSLAGSLIAALPWERLGLLAAFDFGSQVQVVFGVALVAMLVGVALTLASVPEVPLQPTFSLEEGPSSGSGEEEADSSGGAPLPAPGCTHCSCLAEVVASLQGSLHFVLYMSPSFLRLWLFCFLSWLAYLSMYLFLTTFVGEVVYGGLALTADRELRLLYNAGVRTGCMGLAVLSTTAFLSSLSSEWLSRRVGLSVIVWSGNLLYTSSLAVLLLHPSVATVISMCAMAGIFMANLLSVPFALLAELKDVGRLMKRAWPEEGDVMGKAVSFLWMSMFFAQFLLACLMGYLMSSFGGAKVIMWVALCCGGLSSVGATLVSFSPRTRG